MYLAEIITGVLLPWVLLAPTIPLLLLLITRRSADSTTLAMALLCVASLLSNIFTQVAYGSELHRSFLHISFLAEIIFTGLLLKFCTENNLHRYIILASVFIFGSVYISFLALTSEDSLWWISTTGPMLMFLMAIMVLLRRSGRVDQNIVLAPEFWFAGGVFLRFGSLSLLLVSGKKISDLDYNSPDDFAIFYVIIFVIQFLFFAGGILIRKPWTTNK